MRQGRPVRRSLFPTTKALPKRARTKSLRMELLETRSMMSSVSPLATEIANQAPVIHAGADQQLSGTALDAVLDGTVTDDGLPGPAEDLTTTWTQVSGPSLVRFADASAVKTSVYLDTPGVYVLRLEASDGEAVSADELTIQLNQPQSNTAPQVAAGADQQIVLGKPLALDGTVSDDGKPGTLKTAWVKVRGPGEVTFSDTKAVDTTATFSAAGQYTLRLEANDGALTSSDTIVVTVSKPAATPVTVSFQNGVRPSTSYNGMRDAYITDTAKTTNYGAASRLQVDNSADFAALLRWDLGSIPTGSKVTAATLTLDVTNPSRDTYEVYQLLRNWTEKGVTWNATGAGNSWQSAGAQGAQDRGSAVLGTVLATAAGLVTVQLNDAGLAAVQSWVNNPGSNYGIIVQDYDNASDGVDFTSREGTTASRRPKLTVTYVSDSTTTDPTTPPPTNQAPVVNAGADQEISRSQAAALDGTVTDDGKPNPVTTTWSKASGPGTVAFGDAKAVDTTATFSAAGSYVLKLEATDGQATTSDLITLTVSEVPQSVTGFFVSANGSSKGDGSIDNPWDLKTALAQPGAVKPGDTIWLREGTYRGGFTSTLNGTADKPIIVRAYPGEHVTIDAYNGDPNASKNSLEFIVRGSNTWFWGMEFTCTDPYTRVSKDTGPWAEDIRRGTITNRGSNNKFINLVIHDLTTGIGHWSEGAGGDVYGSIIYNNGYVEQSGNRWGHGIYTQNATGTKSIVDNVLFSSFKNGISVYGSSNSQLKNYDIEGNVVFNSGAATGEGYAGGYDILVGGGSPAENITLANNYTYQSGDDGWVMLGYGADGNKNLKLTGNYFVDQLNFRKTWTGVTSSGNTVVGSVSGSAPSSGISTAAQGTGTKVVVRPNEYEQGRANVIVYNWEKAPTVAVDLSNVLSVGSTYEIHNVLDVFGKPVVSGVYTGGKIEIPMKAMTAPQPIGGQELNTPVTIGPEFGTFLVTSTGSSASLTAATGTSAMPASTASLSQSALQPIVDQAIADWAKTGLNEAQVAMLKSVHVSVADLPGVELGNAAAGRITLDSDAAGFGWFVDTTPDEDEEFLAQGSSGLVARDDSPSAGHVDLLTVVMHEMGHLLGKGHATSIDATGDLMSATLQSGLRKDLLADLVDATLAEDLWGTQAADNV